LVYGWIFFAHQMGAAIAAWLGGVIRDNTGDYLLAFFLAGATAVIGSALAARINTRPTSTPQPA
jgi:predicted MFS family arabinose efflux permease